MGSHHESFTIHDSASHRQGQRQDWAYYLRIDPKDSAMLWLVKAMMETELPKPWTCYKAPPETETETDPKREWMGLVKIFDRDVMWIYVELYGF